ncbi:transposable element Tcb1 transposase [Trichonephila clavipes]|nr:transposable element Tcb1 transposase [Trichonephila clavipes]
MSASRSLLGLPLTQNHMRLRRQWCDEGTRYPDLSPIESMWSMVAQRLTQITPPASTPDQLWQRVEVAWSAVLQENIQSLFDSTPRRVAVVISNNGGYSGY